MLHCVTCTCKLLALSAPRCTCFSRSFDTQPCARLVRTDHFKEASKRPTTRLPHAQASPARQAHAELDCRPVCRGPQPRTVRGRRALHASRTQAFKHSDRPKTALFCSLAHTGRAVSQLGPNVVIHARAPAGELVRRRRAPLTQAVHPTPNTGTSHGATRTLPGSRGGPMRPGTRRATPAGRPPAQPPALGPHSK